MQSEYGPRGLTVLGVTSEAAKLTESWIEDKGASYAYAYDKGGKLARHFGVRGIPHAVLVDATGTVTWRGHPGNLDAKVVESALEGAFTTPMWEWSASASGVRSALRKGDLSRALEEARKLDPAGGPDIAALVQGLVTRRLSGLEARRDAGDFLGASELAEMLVKDLKGLPEAEAAAGIAKAIDDDAEAQRVIKGQRKLAKIRAADPTSSKKIAAAIEDLRDLSREFSGTFVEGAADELIADLQDRLKDR